MPLQSLTTALTLYRGTSLTLDQAATHAGITAEELAAQLRSQGVPVREDDPSTAEPLSD